MSVASLASAQARRPTLVVMPAQYFSADAQSAHRVANELAYQFKRRGYNVIPLARSREEFDAMHLRPNRSYSDPVAAKFGRQIGADLVVYPQLMAAGLPYAGNTDESGAVLHIRVLNARSGRRLYSRQVRQPFRAAGSREAGTIVPVQVAGALASKSANFYFERVAGSRQELRTSP
jgi:hypothetical protein